MLGLFAAPTGSRGREFGKWSLGTDLSVRRDFGKSWSAEIEPLVSSSYDGNVPARSLGGRFGIYRHLSASGPLSLRLQGWGRGLRRRTRQNVRIWQPPPAQYSSYREETRDIGSWEAQAAFGLVLEARIPWFHGVTASMAIGQAMFFYRETPDDVAVGGVFGDYAEVPSPGAWPRVINREMSFRSGGFATSFTLRLHL